MKFIDKHFVFFDQCDPAGILYFAESFAFAHRSIERFIEGSSIGWNNWFNNETTAFPIRHASCDYFRPVFAGTQIEVSVVVTDLSPSTVCFSSTATQSGEEKFRVASVHTALDKQRLTKSEIPADIFQKLLQYQEEEQTIIKV